MPILIFHKKKEIKITFSKSEMFKAVIMNNQQLIITNLSYFVTFAKI
jgi:hypothetical protein